MIRQSPSASHQSPAFPGRGSSISPANRFEKLSVELDEEFAAEAAAPKTQFLVDDTKSLITTNDSPDIPFRSSFNAYRGCEHGCAYCYARPYHEYLGFNSGIDFETKILVKLRAPELLRRELSSEKWQPQALAMSGVTDCYQPVERKLELTRRCLEVLLEFRNPVGIVTKNALVTRDLDLLAPLAAFRCARVFLSITTLDRGLAQKLEPRAAMPRARLDTVRQLAAAGVPVGVLCAPIIPGLNDHEIPALLEAAAEAGAGLAGFTILRLPYAVKDVFSAWLDRHYPGHKEKILARVRDLRGGKLNDSRFGRRMSGEGFWAEQIEQLFEKCAARLGLNRPAPPMTTEHFRRPREQLTLF
ncbi:MAG TPA: PA0069 family radical SAM protein [Chthoniobacterales bacterium]